MKTPLDHPVWSALTSRQRSFAIATGSARRFDPQVSAFAAYKDAAPESLDALSDLMTPGADRAYLMQATPIELPPTLEAEVTATGLQLVRQRPSEDSIGRTSEEIRVLGDENIDEMLALAELTKPGPFTGRTPELGTFWGIRIDGRLAAMAGERLNMTDFTEISGVCVHPDFRGKGLAAALSLHVADCISARGDTAFLHAYADNDGALKLYGKLGFVVRTKVNVAIIRRCEA
ncbi:GNAT family N-acetyltransferase [uncultured Roseibium sp.]|uniref:GNAT family N-acetyltransferase n=1 Tax=uncultured Roseibium sp. TaxID=1936171 RepID=UPI0025989E77|nr:GNAT family N-acetyltransferase [uncultured Roseibium sp.]